MFVGWLDPNDTWPEPTAGRSSTQRRHMPETVDPRHLLLIGAGPGVGAGVVRRFGREGFRSTLISRGEALERRSSGSLTPRAPPASRCTTLRCRILARFSR